MRRPPMRLRCALPQSSLLLPPDRVVFKETIQLARIIGIVQSLPGLLLFISPVGNDTGNGALRRPAVRRLRCHVSTYASSYGNGS